MKKKVWASLLTVGVILALVLSFQTKSYAFSGGLLDKKAMFRGASVTSSTYNVVTNWTDGGVGGDSSTDLTGVNYTNNVGWYTFPKVVSGIDSFKLIANADLDVVFYNESNQVIYTYNYHYSTESNKVITLPQIMNNVKTVAIINKMPYSGMLVWEFDVFGANITYPETPGTDPGTEPSSDRAILTITMSNGLEKEYDLSITEVNAFIDWYDKKEAGVGPAKYAFNKEWNKGPFKKRTEYVIFDKILTFNVDEYSVEK
ncbi:hypothetical protein D3C75_728210 [compost metagenome]